MEIFRIVVKKHIEQQSSLETASLKELLILSDVRAPIVREDRVYVPFASRGMLETVQSAKGHKMLAVLDSKQKVIAGSWGVLTIGFLARDQNRKRTSARNHGQRFLVNMHTSTTVPFFQVVIDEETAQNIGDALDDVTALCQRHGDFDLKTQLIQMHKDYAKGIEKARREKFPWVRAVEDYFHMRQAVEGTLPSRLKTPGEEPPPPPPEPLQTTLSQHGVRAADSSTGPRGGGGGAPKGKARAKAKGKSKAKAKAKAKAGSKKYEKPCVQLLNDTRFLPTAQLLDAAWRPAFHMMTNAWREPDAKDYLKTTYFHDVTVDVISRLFKRVTLTAWGSPDFLLAGHWYGILGTAPGSGTGSQSLESRHSFWEDIVEKTQREARAPCSRRCKRCATIGRTS